MDPVTLAAATSRAIAVTGSNARPSLAPEYRVNWSDPEELGSWTVTNGTITADTTVRPPGYTQSMKLTSEAGANARGELALTSPHIGKYWQVWVHVPDITKVAQIQFRFETSDTPDAWSYTWTKASGRLVQGTQVFDAHFDYLIGGSSRIVTGTPGQTGLVTLVRVYALGETGEAAEVNFGPIVNIRRQPGLLFINDGAYTAFTRHVAPLLHRRGIPHQIQLGTSTIADWTSTGGSVEGVATLAEFRRLMDLGAEAGLHFEADLTTYPTLADFAPYATAHVNSARALGVLKPRFLASALQGQTGNPERVKWLGNLAGLVRAGSGYTVTTRLGTQMAMMPPVPSTLPYDIPTREFEHTVTAEDVAGWVTEAVEKETLLSVFGHGSDAENPGQDYRTPLSVYQAFLEEYDANRGQFVEFTASRLLDAMPRRINSRIFECSYRA